MLWYYVDASRRQVETREDLLPGLISSGTIRPETLVWNESLTEWRSAVETLPGLFPALPPVLTAAQRQQLLKAPVGTIPVAGVPTDPVAVCSLVFGFLGLPICFPLFSIPAIICGPGSIAQAHKPDEFITLEQVALCESFMERLLEQMCAT